MKPNVEMEKEEEFLLNLHLKCNRYMVKTTLLYIAFSGKKVKIRCLKRINKNKYLVYIEDFTI